MLLASLYYVLIATDRFVSESKFTIRQTDNSSSPSMASSLLGTPSSKEDALSLIEFVNSFDMLDYLENRLGLRKHYEKSKADYFSRPFPLFRRINKENWLDYYKSHVEMKYDDNSAIVTLRIDAFNPEFAKQVNELILKQCDSFMNNLSNKVASRQMQFIEEELVRVKTRLEKEKVRMAEFQNKYNVLDPAAQAAAAATMVATMEQGLTAQEADLANLKTYLHEDSYQVATLKNKITTLRQQIDKEKQLIASSGSGDKHLNEIALRYINLKTDMDYVLSVYQADLAALEKSRVDASRALKNLVIITLPTLQEHAEYPREPYILATLLLALLIAYSILRLIVATIKEHKELA